MGTLLNGSRLNGKLGLIKVHVSMLFQLTVVQAEWGMPVLFQ